MQIVNVTSTYARSSASGMRTKCFLPGYIVRPETLAIHLFLPDVSEARAWEIDRLLHDVFATQQKKQITDTVKVNNSFSAVLDLDQ